MFALSLLIQAETQAQPRGGRQPTDKRTPTPAPGTKQTGGRRDISGSKRDPAPIKPATLALNLPSGSRVWLNQIEVELRDSELPLRLGTQKITTTYSFDQGVLTVSGLKPGACEITVRKPDHREFVQTLDLFNDRNNEITVHLTPNPGTLTVKPAINGATVEVLNAETNRSLGRYPDRLEGFEIAPGNYRVRTSKDGYVTATREITIRPGESAYLEPVVELLPKPKPAPPANNFGRAFPTSFFVQASGKEEIFRIHGSSGNASTTMGTISVSHGGSSMAHTIAGALTGLPCQVEFVRLENIAEGAVIEPPGPSNQWSAIAIRLRRKDQKRPVSFAINWRSLEPAGVMRREEGDAHQEPTQTFTPAKAVLKIKPNFPGAARYSKNEATVNVLVFIDEFGSVISAKALDGPNVVRGVSEEAAKHWKFSPATRDGKPVESQLTIQFTFQN